MHIASCAGSIRGSTDCWQNAASFRECARGTRAIDSTVPACYVCSAYRKQIPYKGTTRRATRGWQEAAMIDEKTSAAEQAHALQDHAFGRELAHAHAPGAAYDHDHDDFDSQGPLEANPIWIQDHVSLTSVGIDIGSSGTQVIFSQLNLRRLGEDLSSHYFLVSLAPLFHSPVVLTPYKDEERIDQGALGAIIDDAYNMAGVGPEQVDIGAVILTGEALRRENAEAIAG